MLNIKVALPRVHLAGSDAHYDAHLEVGQHGFALFLTPNAETPVIDIDGSLDQLDALVRGLQVALANRRTAGTRPEGEPVQMVLPRGETASARSDTQGAAGA